MPSGKFWLVSVRVMGAAAPRIPPAWRGGNRQRRGISQPDHGDVPGKKDRQQPQGRDGRIAIAEPAPVRARGNAAECRYLCMG